jgi:hypothetical protein
LMQWGALSQTSPGLQMTGRDQIRASC